MDDEREHWSCAWCAVRMCGYCRGVFAEQGVGGLRGRVREAEGGWREEEEVGVEVGRGRRGWG